jgi:hypothetical protein
VPHGLDELRGSLQGSVGLPARLFWSGSNPREVRWDLADPIRRRDLYEIVLMEGTLDDVRELINGAEPHSFTGRCRRLPSRAPARSLRRPPTRGVARLAMAPAAPVLPSPRRHRWFRGPPSRRGTPGL